MGMIGNCLEDNWFMDTKLNTLEGIVDEYLKATQHVQYRAVECNTEKVKDLRKMLENAILTANNKSKCPK